MKFSSQKYRSLHIFISIIALISSCTVVKKYPKDKPFIYQNKINLKIDNVKKEEKTVINSRLSTQLDDSSKVKVKDVLFIRHVISKPPALDTASINRSASNMQASMLHLGYYSAIAKDTFTIAKKGDQQRTTVTYNVTAGKRTLIDTFAYLLNKEEFQQLALQTKKESPLQKGAPISKAAVQAENSRLVDLFRNHGYYKFTADDLRLTGDTTIEALTTVTDDPFEELQLLAEAQSKKDKPTIKLAMILNSVSDSSKYKKYYINDVYILPDYIPGDSYTDSSLKMDINRGYIIKYHKKLFLERIYVYKVLFKKGSVFSQEDYYNTINNFYKLGVWESPAIDIIERKDTNLLDIVIKLIPLKSKSIEGSVELSYSANSNTSNIISSTNSGNLFGLSGNLSVLNRNFLKQAVRMTNSIRAGVEFNTSHKNSLGTLINSDEISYNNNTLIPKWSTPFKKFNSTLNKIRVFDKQTFINVNLSQIKRIDFFDQQGLNLGYGFNWSKKVNRTNSFRLINFDFRRIYNKTDRFDSTLNLYPFLRYSFNTALVMGMSFSHISSFTNPIHQIRHTMWRANIEESGLTWGGALKGILSGNSDNFATKYLRQFIKIDGEVTHTWSYAKTALATRFFIGVGIPLSKNDTTLPFFKQYYGGGPNSMRGWPVRGIGVGGQPLAPYGTQTFNDRTGDIQIEGNLEYRYNIAPLFSNAVLLKGALFMDIGNIWNFKNTKADGSTDTTQFKFNNLYKQLGVSAGTGFRLDFNYFVVRFDVGFRFKRPDVTANSGWQLPDINFNNLFSNSDENKRWRYENFNFTIGIDYPF